MKNKWFIIPAILLMVLVLVFMYKPEISNEKENTEKGYLGVSIKPLDRSLKKELKVDYGVVVSRVEIDSPADEYGLMEDDVIQQIN